MKTLNYLLATSLLASTGAIAGYNNGHNSSYEYAKVVNASPITKVINVNTPRRECWQEEVAYNEPRRHRSATPTILGTIIGGVIGNEIGHNKDSKKVGAIAGAILGGSIGRDIGHKTAYNRGHTRYATEQVCKTYQDTHQEEQIVGYDVSYKYRGNIYQTQTNEHPGKRIKVRVSVTPVKSYTKRSRHSY